MPHVIRPNQVASDPTLRAGELAIPSYLFSSILRLLSWLLVSSPRAPVGPTMAPPWSAALASRLATFYPSMDSPCLPLSPSAFALENHARESPRERLRRPSCRQPWSAVAGAPVTAGWRRSPSPNQSCASVLNPAAEDGPYPFEVKFVKEPLRFWSLEPAVQSAS